MLELIRLRKKHGRPVIKDIPQAAIQSPFRGYPALSGSLCPADCRVCTDVCPTSAIQPAPLRLDLGACLFCGDCAQACPSGAIQFTQEYKLGVSSRARLIAGSEQSADAYHKAAMTLRREIYKSFGRSLKLRQVSAGGCNGCELELAASNNVNFDIGRFGIQFTASPRHADGLVITGPVTANMDMALRDTWESMPEPKLVILTGVCAISGGLYASSDVISRGFISQMKVDLYVPGCPPHPLTFIHAMLDYLGKSHYD